MTLAPSTSFDVNGLTFTQPLSFYLSCRRRNEIITVVAVPCDFSAALSRRIGLGCRHPSAGSHLPLNHRWRYQCHCRCGCDRHSDVLVNFLTSMRLLSLLLPPSSFARTGGTIACAHAFGRPRIGAWGTRCVGNQWPSPLRLWLGLGLEGGCTHHGNV
jgi:hypothetical protein